MADVVEKKPSLDPLLAELEREQTSDRDELLICKYCGNKLAYLSDGIEVIGRHLHVMTNPHGYTYEFRCFSEALGCSIQGQAVGADSWFPGFRWRYAHCGACEIHLGWYFEGTGHFYGLIADKVATENGGE